MMLKTNVVHKWRLRSHVELSCILIKKKQTNNDRRWRKIEILVITLEFIVLKEPYLLNVYYIHPKFVVFLAVKKKNINRCSFLVTMMKSPKVGGSSMAIGKERLYHNAYRHGNKSGQAT